MNMKKILLALLVLLLLGSYFYFFVVKPKKKEEQKEVKTKTAFFGVSEADVVEVEVNNGSQTIKMVKDGRYWNIVEPEKDLCNGAVAESFIRKLLTIRAKRIIKDSDPKDFGIKSDGMKVSVKLKNGATHGLLIGDDNPTGSYAYCMKPDETDKIMLIDNVIKRESEKKYEDFIYKGLARVSENDSDMIKVNLKDKKYILKKDGVRWSMKTDNVYPVRKSKAEQIISSISRPTVAASFEKEKPSEKNGLKGSNEYIEVGANNSIKKIVFGKMTEDSKQQFALSAENGKVVRIPSHTYLNIPAVEDIKSKQVLVFEKEEIGSMDITFDKKFFRAEVDEKGSWKIVKSKNMKKKEIKDTYPSSILAMIYNLDYQEVYDPKEAELIEEKIFGIKAALYDKQGGVIGVIDVGNKGLDKDFIFIRTDKRDKIYKVGRKFIGQLNLPGVEE